MSFSSDCCEDVENQKADTKRNIYRKYGHALSHEIRALKRRNSADSAERKSRSLQVYLERTPQCVQRSEETYCGDAQVVVEGHSDRLEHIKVNIEEVNISFSYCVYCPLYSTNNTNEIE